MSYFKVFFDKFEDINGIRYIIQFVKKRFKTELYLMGLIILEI